jgi:phosphoribosylformylglycinamidine synthase
MRYVPVAGSDLPHNPNGSSRDIAGICNAAGNIVGYMPHPERLADDVIGGNAGHRFFTSLIERLGAGVAA